MRLHPLHRNGLPLAVALCALLGTARAQQAPQQPTQPRAPLGPGSQLQRPFPPETGPRTMAPIRDEPGTDGTGRSPTSGPLARQDQQISLFRSALAAALTRSSATTPPQDGILIVNTTNGAFAGLLKAGGEARRFGVAGHAQGVLRCEDCREKLALTYHDGFAARIVEFQQGSRVYVIVHPLYERFEIITQTETARLAGVTP